MNFLEVYMPIFSPSTISAGAQNIDQAPRSWSSIFDSLSNNLQDIARKLFSATRNQTPPPGRQIQAAPNQAEPNQAAPNAAATAGVAGPLTATNAAKVWLSTECDNLLRDLSSRDANGNQPNTLGRRTSNLYALAREFKDQIGIILVLGAMYILGFSSLFIHVLWINFIGLTAKNFNGA